VKGPRHGTRTPAAVCSSLLRLYSAHPQRLVALAWSCRGVCAMVRSCLVTTPRGSRGSPNVDRRPGYARPYRRFLSKVGRAMGVHRVPSGALLGPLPFLETGVVRQKSGCAGGRQEAVLGEQ